MVLDPIQIWFRGEIGAVLVGDRFGNPVTQNEGFKDENKIKQIPNTDH